MPITKDGAGVIQYTSEQNRHNDGVAGGTGVHMASQFAVADDVDVLKQIKFNASAQATNTNFTLKSQSVTPGTDVVITLPNVTGTLVTTTNAGISQLTGEVTAGPGTGSVAAVVAGRGTGTGSFRLGPTSTGTGDSQLVMGSGATGGSGIGNTILGTGATGSTAGMDTVVGQGSSSGNGGNSTIIGQNISGGAGSTALGSNSTVQKNSIGVGHSQNLADATTGANIGIGNGLAIQGNSANCVGIGTNLLIPTGNSNIVVWGDTTAPLNTYYFGQGLSAATTADVTFASTPRTGSNAAGAAFIIQAGNGTGTGGSGTIKFQTAPTAGSSSTANTMATVGQVTAVGAWSLGASSTTPQHVINSVVKTNGTQVGTLTNAPTAGNPTGFLQITINGTTSYIPYWQ